MIDLRHYTQICKEKGFLGIFLQPCRQKMITDIFDDRMKNVNSVLNENTSIIGSLRDDIVNIIANFGNIYDGVQQTINTVVEEIILLHQDSLIHRLSDRQNGRI